MIAGLVALAPPGDVAAQAAAYRDFAGLTRELRTLADGSRSATLRSLGASHQGREIWMVEIADPDGPPVTQRPGVLVVGNLSGDHLLGSHLALEAIRHLLGEGGAEADLRQHVVYVVPRLNPDGAERMFSGARDGGARNALPFDDDNDGRTDEDGPGGVDLDRSFQHEYPYWERDAGPYMVSEPESRALMDFMVAHRNVAAVLTLGHSDNLVAPPTARGELAAPSTLDLVSFAAASNAGVFDVGVTRAQQGFGFGGGGFGGGFGGGTRLRGAQRGADNDPNSGRRPATTVDGGDREYFNAVSEAYREITGVEAVGINRKAEGAFFQFGYYQYGVPSFSTQGW
ncbi:MAG TPA: M14 family zinc carboxypeptidase, partial [Longimicrobiales bacterium]|nr:M14 family zinc carboxypeptidase [Longimicrobiales bacterium]